MDNLTHTAVGLFLSRAGWNSRTPRATAILLLAANAPDIDIVTLAGGPVNYLHYHRHLTHSLLAMPVMAILSVLLVRFAGRKPVNWAPAFLAALTGVASHLLLDLTNVYRVRLLLPFSGEWLGLDTTGVVDYCIWAILLLGIAAPFVGRLVTGEITSKASRPKHYGRGGAIFALLFVTLYDCGRLAMHSRAVAELQSRLYRDAAPVRVIAMPVSENPLRWRGLVETATFYAVPEVDLSATFDPTRAPIYEKAEDSPAIEAIRTTYDFREFLRFSQAPLWRVTPSPDVDNAKLVEVLDLRFGRPGMHGAEVIGTVDAQNRVIETAVQWGAARTRKTIFRAK